MTNEIDDLEEELEQEDFRCHHCHSRQGCWLEPSPVGIDLETLNYWCEICDAPEGEPAKDERYPTRFDR